MFALLIAGTFLMAAVAQAGPEPGAADRSGKLDLNRATAVELVALPGIGEVKAAAILAVRDTLGGFGSLEELEQVRGIGPAMVARLRPLVKLSPTTSSGAKSVAATAKVGGSAPKKK